MPNLTSAFRAPAAGALFVLTLTCLGLTACGGSSGSTSSHPNAAVSSSAGAPTATNSSTGASPSTGGTSSKGGAQGSAQAPRRLGGSAFTKALAKFAACLRQNGVNIPTPSTSGKGPVFNVKGLRTNSPQFKAASAKCRGVLLAAFRNAQSAGGRR